ncbi:MAG: DUF4235 domain-containing protein [Dermatophilaceae bacterium]
MGTLAWKLLGTGGTLLAGVLAGKVVDAVWAKAGQDSINPKSPDAPLTKAMAYAALTGLAVGTAKTLTTRKAARYYERSSGHLPKQIRDDAA